MAIKKEYLIMILLSVLILALGVFLSTKTNPPKLEQTGAASIEVLEQSTHDWGEIDIAGGNVEKVFQIKNTGTADLVLENFVTSCMCTEARVIIDGTKSPIFGMHSRSGWNGAIKPGQTADIQVVFDPMAHGPDAVGPISRTISFDTNDTGNPTIELKINGDVVKK